MSEKFEDLLNLALKTPAEQRAMTEDLNVGFLADSGSFELIVKYHGSLDGFVQYGIVVEYLIDGYAILTVPETKVDLLGATPEIEYVEKPKRFFYEQMEPLFDVCVRKITLGYPYLTGNGVMLAVIDSGIDIYSPCFRNEDGSTRIRYLWDQSITPQMLEHLGLNKDEYSAPQGFFSGVEFTKEMIDEALTAQDRSEGYFLVPSLDVSGHGTAVTAIAACSKSEKYGGVAGKADLLIVKMGPASDSGFPQTTQVMRGVTYAIRKALERNQPLVINLSFGNQYGAHDGSSLLERFLDSAAQMGRTSIFVGMGNDGNTACHFAGNVKNLNQVNLNVAPYEKRLNVQLWKNFADDYQVDIISPEGQQIRIEKYGKSMMQVGGTRLLIYQGEALPYSVNQEIYIEWIPEGERYIEDGVWSFRFRTVKVVEGSFNLYVSKGENSFGGTGFEAASPWATFTIPSTAQRVISVGAYDSIYDSYADFSGRGLWQTSDRRSANDRQDKPDIAAPGVNVFSIGKNGELIRVSGTSFATPFAAGVGALLMEWGIVRGKDPFLYGEKMKAILRRDARELRGEEIYPNAKVGYGAICVKKINEMMYN